MRARRNTVLALVALLLCGRVPVAAEELRPEQRYVGGVRVESSEAGVAFSTAPGWSGTFRQTVKHRALVMGSETIEGVALAIIETGQTPEQLLNVLSETQDLGDGVRLRPTRTPIVDGSRMAGRYENNAYVGIAVALVGPRQTNVIFFVAGPHRNEDAYKKLLVYLGESTQFFTPGGAATAQAPSPSAPPPVAQPPAGSSSDPGASRLWSERLAGQALNYFSTYNSGGSSGGMASHKVLHLCPDGRFTYLGDSSVTMNVPGASGSSGGRTGFRGQWALESPTSTTTVLVLTGEDNRELRWIVRYDGQKVYVNNRYWPREPSNRCR